MSLEPSMLGWAARLSACDERALDTLRLAKEVEAARSEEAWWVRGPVPAGDEAAAWRGLPADARFEWLADGRLRVSGERVPCGRLPTGVAWTPLSDLVKVTLPPRLPPVLPVDQCPLRLVRGGGETIPDALLLGLDVWAAWATGVAAVRLLPLRFAVLPTPETSLGIPAATLVLGLPLPPLPGARLVSREGILVPAGWAWQPAVEASVVRRLLGLRADEMALWPGAGAPLAFIPAEAVVPASRRAVRLTLEKSTESLTREEP